MKLSDIKHLLSTISPWPWEAYASIPCCPDMGGVIGPKGSVCASALGTYGHPMLFQDAEFIAASPQIIDQLVKQNEVMKKALQRTKTQLDTWGVILDYMEEALQKCEELENE